MPLTTSCDVPSSVRQLGKCAGHALILLATPILAAITVHHAGINVARRDRGAVGQGAGGAASATRVGSADGPCRRDVTISSVGAWAIGVAARLLRYPRLPVAIIVGSDRRRGTTDADRAGRDWWLGFGGVP
jgi:hypothetical protein